MRAMKQYKLRISVYDFDNHRAFFRAAYKDIHSQWPDCSYRYLQRSAGYSPHSNHFWQIISGCSSLSTKAAQRYGKVFGLSRREIQYLSLLAGLHQAGNDTDRKYYLDQLRMYPQYNRNTSEGKLRFEFYQQWYLPALREVVALESFREDPAWIARRLTPRITAKQARLGIKQLLELGFLVRDEYGCLHQSKPIIGTPENRQDNDPVATLAVREFHRTMIDLAKESIDNQPQDRRFVVGTTMAVSNNQVARIRDAMKAFNQEINCIIAENEPIETVARINMQLFHLVQEDEHADAKPEKR